MPGHAPTFADIGQEIDRFRLWSIERDPATARLLDPFFLADIFTTFHFGRQVRRFAVGRNVDAARLIPLFCEFQHDVKFLVVTGFPREWPQAKNVRAIRWTTKLRQIQFQPDFAIVWEPVWGNAVMDAETARGVAQAIRDIGSVCNGAHPITTG